MNPLLHQFLAALFDEHEETSFGWNEYGVKVRDWKTLASWSPSYLPAFVALNPLRDRRKDANVTAYRNFLIEFDDMPLDQQRPFVDQIGLPWTTCTYSGSKSFHFVLCLDQDLESEEVYRALGRRIMAAVERADRKCANPSRFSRCPFHTRAETGQVQALIEVRRRVSLDEVEAWLVSRGVPDDPAKRVHRTPLRSNYEPNPYRVSNFLEAYDGGLGVTGLRRETLEYLKYGASEGERNQALFKAACNYAEAGYTVDEAEEDLGERAAEDGLGRTEIRTTLKSAYQRVEG